MAQWLTSSKPTKRKRRNTRSAASRRAANEAHDRLCGAVIRMLVDTMNVAATHCKATFVKRGDLAYWQPFAGIKGHPDVMGPIIPTGVMLYVECKTGTAKRTPEQVRVCRDLADAGCLVYVVRDYIDDATAETMRNDVTKLRRMIEAGKAAAIGPTVDA